MTQVEYVASFRGIRNSSNVSCLKILWDRRGLTQSQYMLKLVYPYLYLKILFGQNSAEKKFALVPL